MGEVKPIGPLKDSDGDWSSKRIWAFCALAAAVALAVLDKPEAVEWFLIAGAAVLGVQAWTKT